MTHTMKPSSSRSFIATSSGHCRLSQQAAFVFFVVFSLFLALEAFADTAEGNAIPPSRDGRGFEDVSDPALSLFAELGLTDSSIDSGDLSQLDLDRLWVLEHFIPLGDGRFVYAQESFTFRAYLRRPARAALFLNGSAFVGNSWSTPVEGYNATKMLADEGYFAFTVDYLGTGRSFVPDDGSNAEYEDNREAMEHVLRYIRFFRSVPRVDLLGAGYGGAIASELAADPSRVRSVRMTAMIYKEVKGGPLTNPGFVGFLSSRPDNYVFLEGRGPTIFSSEAPPEVGHYTAVTQGGFYPVDNFLVATERPFFDPSKAKVPGLLIYGGRDFIAARSDIEELAEDYGVNGAHLVIREDVGHAPGAGSPEIAAWIRELTLEFLENPHSF